MTFSPRIAAYALLGVLLVIALIAILSFLSDPFGFKARKIDRLGRENEVAQSDLKARTLESQGQAEQITRIESAGRLTIDVNAITAEAVANARTAADANEPLEAGRVDRLRQLDDRLCDLRPAACASAPDLAGTGDADVPAADPAG